MAALPVQFKNNGEHLFGMLHLPERKLKTSFPAVLFLHGFMAHRIEANRIFVKMSRILEANGIASLRFDFRGCGDSDGDSAEVTLEGELSDAQKAFEFLSQHPQIDPQRIAVLGMSIGGGLGALLASKEPRVSALLLWVPVANLMECMEMVNDTEQDLNEIFNLPYVDHKGQRVGRDFLAGIPTFKPAETLKNFNKPICVIQAEADQIVPVHQSEIYEEVFRGKNSLNARHLIEGSDHKFSSTVWQDQLFEKSTDFLKKVWF